MPVVGNAGTTYQVGMPNTALGLLLWGRRREGDWRLVLQHFNMGLIIINLQGFPSQDAVIIGFLMHPPPRKGVINGDE